MKKLWESKKPDMPLNAETPKEWKNVRFSPERYVPYKRLYGSLSQSQLLELIQDAQRLHWEVLDLRNCGLNALPEELGFLPNLRVLALGNWGIMDRVSSNNNSFSALPMSVGELKNLQSLDLHRTGITFLPDSIGNLSNLRTITLEDSPISTLPDSIGKLSNLVEIHAYGSSLAALPDTIGNLKKLQRLVLNATNITTLPESIGQLAGLQYLSLADCRLKMIPYSLVKLGLPFIIKTPLSKHGIDLRGVTLDEGDLSLFDQPLPVIEAYYRKRMSEAEAAKGVNECKVIFLGDGVAGKSSLIERILHGRFEAGSLPTDGVKMTKWSAYANGKPLTLNGRPLTIRFLDFGGQEIMHSMHRCFLTAHTVYVVVFESRDDAEIDNVAIRWMETVKSFAPECPVLLVLNKVDMNPHVTINERTLRAGNPRYLHTLRTSAKTGQGVQQLIEDILAEVPDCLQKMNGNRDWLGLKQELEDMEDDYILPDKFRERCDHFRIREELRAGVLNWFQDLGVAYTYQTTFQDMYVLNPAWLTNGIYRLILRTPGGGFLRHGTIRETLGRSCAGDMSNKTYTGQEMEFILHIMRKFEISLYLPPALGGGDGMEMVPMKLGKTPPDRYDDFHKGGALHLRWEAPYLPNNLVHRLMIRKYPELDPMMEPEAKCVWRTGGWFRSTDGCEALAELTDRSMDVYVRDGQDPRLYMDSFRREILHILRQLGIGAQEWIYHTVNGKTGRIPYEYVMKRRRRGKKEIYLGDIDEDVSIEELLQMNYIYAGEESRDFFISYNNKRDGERAAWIANTLRENGYTIHFQADDCKPGMNFAQWMAEALSNSRGFLAVWSGAYEDSQYCKDELNAAYIRTHTDKRFLLVPVRTENVKVTNPLFAGVVHVDVFSHDDTENRKALLKAVEQIRRIQ